MTLADLSDPAVRRHYEAQRAWPSNGYRVYRDRYEELILTTYFTQWRIRNMYRKAIAATTSADARGRLQATDAAYTNSLAVLRDVLREGRAG